MMDSGKDEKKMIEEPLLGTQKGGFRTMPFIIVIYTAKLVFYEIGKGYPISFSVWVFLLANLAFERMASFGLGANMIIYLMTEYHLDMATGSNILFFWSAATNITPVIGAFVADSTVGRFSMIGFGSIITFMLVADSIVGRFSIIGIRSIATFMGMILLWLTSVIPQARPVSCAQSSNDCTPPTYPQLIVLCSSFSLMAIGAGGIRASSLAFGADQLERNDTLKGARALQSYFSWSYVSIAVGALLAMTCIVYIQEKLGWGIGFGVPVVLMFFSVISFFLASPFYVKVKPSSSLLLGFAQVIVVCYKRWDLKYPSLCKDIVYHNEKGSRSINVPSEKLRFLNRACVITDTNKELTSDGRASDPWTLCTIDQVEELKALIKVIPLWSTGIMINVTMSQSAFPVLQATSMDRHITPNFEIPAASFGTFVIISLTIWIALYDRLILPIASKAMGKTVCISPKHRMGIGLFVSSVTMFVTSFVEHVRRTNATKNYLALWLVPQNSLSGIAEAFNAIGQNEFYYSEFPRSMSSIAFTLIGVGFSVGNLFASFIMSTVNNVTRRDGKESWVSSDINKGHYDYYFFLLGGLSLLNVLYFLVCDRAYGSSSLREESRSEDKEEVKD